MRPRLRRLAHRIDLLSLRERVLLLGALLVAAYSLWDMFLMQPLHADRQQLTERLQTLSRQLTVVEQETQALLQRPARDPAIEQHQRVARLQGDIRDLDLQLRDITATLIEPTQMVRIFEDLLVRRGGLTLIRVQSLAPEPFLEPSDGAAAAPDPLQSQVYRHRLELEFRGSYLAALDYLRAVEALPWELFWDSLVLEVVDYPETQITITVHTLSLREGWIGV